MSHTNSNGLVNGNIPAGQACHFLGHCKFKQTSCPSTERPHTNPFSCAAARLHSMVSEVKAKGSAFTAVAKDILTRESQRRLGPETTNPFTGDEVVIIDDDGYTD